MSLLTPEIKAHLTTLYSHPSRHYHNLSHVHALLDLLDLHKSHFEDIPGVEAAIWFHDAIYDPQNLKGNENELQSAELAVKMLTTAGVDIERVNKVKDMIEATASHTLPSRLLQSDLSKKGEARDLALFLDMDLSILGSENAKYEWYESMVRKEYHWVAEQDWLVGRAEVLRRLLGHSSKETKVGAANGMHDNEEKKEKFIYHTDLFRGLFEGQARVNMQGSVDSLE